MTNPKKEQFELSSAVTIDAVTFTVENDTLKVLLIKRKNAPFRGQWALPGGALRMGETTKKAALRVLKEKAGVEDVYIEQLYTFDDPDRDPRGRTISIAYFALAPRHKLPDEKGDNKGAQAPALYPVNKLPEDLAFDHERIIQYAASRLRAKLEYTNVVYSLLPQEFTFRQIREAYEAILGKELDKRNFRKKFLSLGLIEPTGKKEKQAAHRPAKLYRFKEREFIELKKFF